MPFFEQKYFSGYQDQQKKMIFEIILKAKTQYLRLFLVVRRDVAMWVSPLAHGVPIPEWTGNKKIFLTIERV